MIEANQCGIQAKPDDPVSFAETVLAFRAMRQEDRFAMGERARRLAETCFARSQQQTTFVQVIEHVKRETSLED